MDNQSRIVDALFQTRALRISPPEEPFFYTSGTIGPYYINTHFLFGSEADANELLQMIEEAVRTPGQLTRTIWPRIERQYQEQETYRLVIDALADLARHLPCDFISGGERRDFFFSLPVSRLLDLPHVSILKSGDAWSCPADDSEDQSLDRDSLKGQAALHISDLVTEASSYTRTWIPTIQNLGARMPDTLTVVDRDQGGGKTLSDAGTSLHALTVFSPDLFVQALRSDLITEAQYGKILQFLEDPNAFQYGFLREHPDFLDGQIARGGKNADRARLMKARFNVD